MNVDKWSLAEGRVVELEGKTVRIKDRVGAEQHVTTIDYFVSREQAIQFIENWFPIKVNQKRSGQ